MSTACVLLAHGFEKNEAITVNDVLHRADDEPRVRALLSAQIRVGSEPVVTDGPVVTSRGPGMAMGFALVPTERLAGAAVARQLAERMLVEVE